jgi:hypothetical protein
MGRHIVVGLVHGVGINDSGYITSKYVELPKVDGKRKLKRIWCCPYYQKWKSMILRCYDHKFKMKWSTYEDCHSCDEWKYFSSFKKWVDSQPNKDWENCHLDKDLLLEGNRVYCPNTCVFISSMVNIFIIEGNSISSGCLRGASLCSKGEKYQARCNDPFKIKKQDIGVFETELEAHLAWQAKKHEYACQLAELQDDNRVADALRQRYAPDKDWTIKKE